MNNIKLFRKLLDESLKGSALMGGAIVDSISNLKPKDYDIFHTYKPGKLFVPENWKMTAINFNDEAWVLEHQKKYLQGVDGFGQKPIGSVYEYLVDGEHLVQMIGVMYDNPIKHMANFDHSLTLGYYSHRGIFIHRKVFETLDTRTIEYVSKNNDVDARIRSLERAQAKALKFGGDWNYKGFDKWGD